jgi:hypothetical protein
MRRYMSRQYPDGDDFDYLVRWGNSRICGLTRKRNFSEVGRVARCLWAVFLVSSCVKSRINSPAEKWLAERFSDLYYAINNVRRRDDLLSQDCTILENELLSTCDWIVAYCEVNIISAGSTVALGQEYVIPPSWFDRDGFG